MDSKTEAAAIIAKLGLQPHPEGGWYRQTWQGAEVAERAVGTAIHFRIINQVKPSLIRVDADEVWLWHAGARLTLLMAPDAVGPLQVIPLGGDVLDGQHPQAVVPKGWWQAAEPTGAWTLVSCTVSPGFRFDGFELAAPGFLIGGR